MGFYEALDAAMGGWLPGGVDNPLTNIAQAIGLAQPSSQDLALRQAAGVQSAVGGMTANARGVRGSFVTLVGRMTPTGFVAQKAMRGRPLMTTGELGLLDKAKRVGRRLGAALGMVNAYRRGRVVYGRGKGR